MLKRLDPEQLPSRITGVMSGTSCDGLDFAQVVFSENTFHVEHTACYAFPKVLEQQLRDVRSLSGLDILLLEKTFTQFLSQCASDFERMAPLPSESYAIHGHTAFHVPHQQFTAQLFHLPTWQITHTLPTVFDFRSPDILLGGQGAPLVPIGDRDLFPQETSYLNLGGIANISIRTKKNTMEAFDICACNAAMQHIMKNTSPFFDKDGLLGRQGEIEPHLLRDLNTWSFLSRSSPKSLGIEDVEAHYFNILHQYHTLSVENQLRTLYEHISEHVSTHAKGRLLLSGGGAHNLFLVECIREKHPNIRIPSKQIIDFKEAIVFAYLGYLRLRGKNNTLSSVTGASKDHSAGTIIW